MPGGLQIDAKPWAPEEDHVILALHAADGPKWSVIVQSLPGRTISSVRNRWQRLEKGRKLREEGREPRNRCHACGQPKRGHICYAKASGGPQVMITNPIRGGSPDASPPSYPPALTNAPYPSAHNTAPYAVGAIRSARRHAGRASGPLGQPSVPISSDVLMSLPPQLDTLDFLPALGVGPSPMGEPPRAETGAPAPATLPLAEAQLAADDADAGAFLSVAASPVTVSAEPPPSLTVDLSVVRPPAPSANRRKVSFSFGGPLEAPAAAPAAAVPAIPALARSNTSFFNSLVDSACFTPSSAAIFDAWAGPAAVPPEPPSLGREASFSQLQIQPPPLQRSSFDSFNRAWQTESPAMVRLAA